MSHNGNNGRTTDQIVLVVFLLLNSVLHLRADVFGSKAKLIGHDVNGLSVQTLINADHDTNGHTRTDNLRDGHVHHRCQL